MEDSITQKCALDENDVFPMEREKAEERLKQLKAWELSRDAKQIFRTFNFKNFREAVDFVNDVANLAEKESHYPDIIIRCKKVTLELTTRAIKGLSENDFVVADKINVIAEWKIQWERRLTSRPVLIAMIIILFFVLVWQYFFK